MVVLGNGRILADLQFICKLSLKRVNLAPFAGANNPLAEMPTVRFQSWKELRIVGRKSRRNYHSGAET